jgi:hypothetical protein
VRSTIRTISLSDFMAGPLGAGPTIWPMDIWPSTLPAGRAECVYIFAKRNGANGSRADESAAEALAHWGEGVMMIRRSALVALLLLISAYAEAQCERRWNQ